MVRSLIQPTLIIVLDKLSRYDKSLIKQQPLLAVTLKEKIFFQAFAWLPTGNHIIQEMNLQDVKHAVSVNLFG